MIVVSNTSPLIALAAIDHLDLLQDLFSQVAIPPAVLDELEVGDNVQRRFRLPAWLAVQPIREAFLLRSLQTQLDVGEAAAITLAAESGAELLLIDERRGRSVARNMGLRVMGVAGVLIAAKRKALIPRVRPCLDALLTQAGFRLSQGLVERILVEVGEQD